MSNTVCTLKAFAGVLALCTAATAQAVDYKASCDAIDDGDASMSAHYTHTVERAVFNVSFKAPAGAGFATGNAVRVVVDGRRVATVILDRRSNGAVGGSVSLDSYGNAGDTGPGVTPFPPNWPGVTPQSVVQVASLGCRLAP